MSEIAAVWVIHCSYVLGTSPRLLVLGRRLNFPANDPRLE